MIRSATSSRAPISRRPWGKPLTCSSPGSSRATGGAYWGAGQVVTAFELFGCDKESTPTWQNTGHAERATEKRSVAGEGKLKCWIGEHKLTPAPVQPTESGHHIVMARGPRRIERGGKRESLRNGVEAPGVGGAPGREARVPRDRLRGGARLERRARWR